jgi:hypothetical protein
LCILEIEQAVANNEKEMVSIRKSIKENFVGSVIFHTVNESSFLPHCNVRCGGYLANCDQDMYKKGTVGIFGEIRSPLPKDLSEGSNVIVLSSGHVICNGQIAHISDEHDLKRIGRCIWPNKEEFSSNFHDISVVQLDESVLTKLKRSIWKTKVIVDELPKADLTDRKVFKYGATTGRTEGYIQKINDFKMFGGDAMIIVPKTSDDEDNKFSEKGDSGAVVLTRIRSQHYAIGMVFGGQFDVLEAECRSAKNESIAIGLKKAVNRFSSHRKVTIEFDEI